MKPTRWRSRAEGDPISIAEKRTIAQAGRKIIVGSTPTEEGISVVERLYSESDQRVYEVPCPACGAFHEIHWEDIVCEVEHDPTTAKYLCRSCGAFVEERNKPWMIANGRWRATRPEVANHRGYRVNALVSLLANATWPQLMAEWFRAKRGGPAEMQPFVNQVLGRTWKTSINAVDADVLRARVEPFGLPTQSRPKVVIPRPVLLITVGADVQDDRIEASILGWPRTGAPYVLGHVTFDGNTLDDEVWSAFDKWLRATRWRNERGWRMGIDAVAVDSGGREGRTQKIYNWCHARHSRRIYAVKGVSGPRRLWERAKKVKGDMRLVNVAVDVAKTSCARHDIARPVPASAEWRARPSRSSLFRQPPRGLVRAGHERASPASISWKPPGLRFELARPGSPNEALDCCVYAYAVRFSPAVLSIHLDERDARQPEPLDGAAPRPPRRSWGNGQPRSPSCSGPCALPAAPRLRCARRRPVRRPQQRRDWLVRRLRGSASPTAPAVQVQR